MALTVDGLKTAMLDATTGATNAAAAMTALGNAVAKYITDNNEVTFAWVAVNPDGEPDSTTTPKGKIQNLIITLTPSMADNQATALNYTKMEFIAGLSASTYTITDSGFSVSPGAMASSGTILNLTLTISGSDRDSAFSQFANCIVTWVTAQVPTVPCAGSHSSYTGAGTVTKIT